MRPARTAATSDAGTRARTTAAVAALSSLALAGTLLGAPAAVADPTALYPVTAGTAGTYTYDAQVGPGQSYDGSPAVCVRVTISHVTSTEPDTVETCYPTLYDTLVGDRRILLLEGYFMAAGDDPIFTLDMYGAPARTKRLRLKVDGRRTVTLQRTSSKLLRIDGERVRVFHHAKVSADPLSADAVQAQARKCRKVRGKKKCSWSTIADNEYLLLP